MSGMVQRFGKRIEGYTKKEHKETWAYILDLVDGSFTNHQLVVVAHDLTNFRRF